MAEIGEHKAVTRGRVYAMASLVLVAALLMGAPTLRGSFVGGDDHRLVLDHVLVNHPSLEHAIKLFTILHRDLYQPLPLLSFSAEFAVALPLGLLDKGVEGGAWLFHLTNVLLHAINALLVFAVILTLRRKERDVAGCVVATIAAVLFAVHPLQVEVVAWINGRMMLLSTLFALASLVALAMWLDGGRRRWAVATILCVACCAMSKIRVGLPFLLVIVPLLRYHKLKRPFVFLWLVCAAITAAFAYVNYVATARAGMFSGAAENLHGPPTVRSLLALAWYVEHFVWPAGLASWYPTPGLVQWSDPATLRALAILLPTMAIVVWSAMQSRVALFGFGWFAVTIASTLQLVPTRNALAADRYLYLPIVGLFWVMAVGAYAVGNGAARRWPALPVKVLAAPIGLALVIAMMGTSWQVASYYETPIAKSERIAMLAPNTPHVWERVAWAYYKAGRYVEAINCAHKELTHDDKSVRCAAYQIIGTVQMALGQHDDALVTLRRAKEEDPSNSQAWYHLAKVLEELQRFEEALPLFEKTVEMAPLANPRIHRLAALYRRLERTGDARTMYHKALVNNPYDVKATMALAELDIGEGAEQTYQAAEQRLMTLLDWMPENADAWVNLGVARHGLGRTAEAIGAYQQALANEPSHATAALNLALIYYYQTGDTQRAAPLFERAAAGGLKSIEQVATRAYAALLEGQYDQAGSKVEVLCAAGAKGIEARQQLLRAFAAIVKERPEEPWIFCLAAQLWLADGRVENARAFIDLCEHQCQDAACRDRVEMLRGRLPKKTP